MGSEFRAEVHCGSDLRSCGLFPVPAAAVELLAVWERLCTGELLVLLGYLVLLGLHESNQFY